MKRPSPAQLKPTELGIVIWVVILLLACALFLAKDFIPFRTLLNDQGLAAWTQALFSVVAIVAAAWIANRQSRETQRHDRLKQREQDIRHVESIRSLFSLVTDQVDELKEYWKSDDLDGLSGAAFTLDIEVLTDLRDSFRSIPPLDVPSAVLLMQSIAMVRYLQAFVRDWNDAGGASGVVDGTDALSFTNLELALEDCHGAAHEGIELCDELLVTLQSS